MICHMSDELRDFLVMSVKNRLWVIYTIQLSQKTDSVECECHNHKKGTEEHEYK